MQKEPELLEAIEVLITERQYRDFWSQEIVLLQLELLPVDGDHGCPVGMHTVY